MIDRNISLIYPFLPKKDTRLLISDDDLKTIFGDYLYCRDFDISEFMTDSVEIIKYRQEIFVDILNEPEVLTLMEEILPILENINELYRLRDNSHETEGQIYSIKLIELYIEFINRIYFKASKFKEYIKSRSLWNFSEIISEIANSDGYKNLVLNIEKLSKDISKVKSITIGMNIDSSFTPYEFGILSLNDEYMVSSDLIDRLTNKIDEKKLSSICPLKVTSKVFSKEEKRFADLAINSAINRLLKGSIKEWEPAIKQFFRQNTKIFLPLIKEIKYILFGAKILKELNEKHLPLTMPLIKPKTAKAFDVKGIYNPLIALQKDKTVYNDINFDDNGRIYIITGPNSGGKSVFTSAVGICQVFSQLGFLVPAKYAEISTVDSILVHFANKSNSKSKGRLEEECIKMKNIFDQLTEHSLILLDETFSSTSAFEGTHIAFDVLAGLSAYGCRGIFSTHLHELVSIIGKINNNPNCLSKIDTLTVDIDYNGNRTYRIIRKIPDGKSYAKTISDKYGLSFDEIINNMSKK